MDEPIVENILEEFSSLPRSDDGRVDYTNAPKAPVLICFIRCDRSLLLLKRSNEVYAYKNLWSTVAGFIDEQKGLKEKIFEELEEEIGVTKNMVSSIQWAPPYEYVDNFIGKTWIRYVAIADLRNKPDIKLNWEHVDYVWVKLSEIERYKTVPGTDKNLAVIKKYL